MLNFLNNQAWTYFVKNPSARHHIRELAKIVKLSPATVLKLAAELKKYDLIKTDVIGRSIVISLNYDNDNLTFYKKWTNLFLFLDSGIAQEIDSENLILFGSYALGEDSEKSDIDLAADKTVDLAKYEKKLNKTIQIHILKDIKNKLLLENIRNGILIKGVMP